MKIIVYNSNEQFALSRKQVEKIKEVLPNEYFDPIQEFHLTTESPGQEKFEYLEKSRQAHLCFPVKQKSTNDVSEAVSELLVGLARIKSKTRWGYHLPDQERIDYQEFLQRWHARCIAALT